MSFFNRSNPIQTAQQLATLHDAIVLRTQFDKTKKRLITLPTGFKQIPEGMTLNDLTKGLQPWMIDDRFGMGCATTESASVLEMTVKTYSVADELVTMFDEGKFDVAHLIYPIFKSALAQDPVTQQLIPAPAPENAESGNAAVEYEPGEEEILEQLLPRYVKTQLFGSLLEREASEQGASMTAMDNATRNAGDMINKLTIQYNRSRQAAITTELVEIISGAEAL